MKKPLRWNLCLLAPLWLVFFSVLGVGASTIQDSESTTHGKDASTYTVVDTYDFGSLRVIQFELPVLSIYSYLLVSDGEALLVDPGRDVSVYLETAKSEAMTIKGVYLTHSHADFVAGHMEIAKAVGCPVYQSKKSGVSYEFRAVEEGDSVSVGKATVRFIDTPGHTPDGMCALVYGPEDQTSPVLAFTGDVLFVGSVGRPDLLEGQVSAAWLASAMFDSWTRKISKFGEEVRIFPAHGAGSLCGAHLSDEPYSTIGKERSSNPYLRYTKRNEFVATLLEGLPEAPQYFKHNAGMNRKGPDLVKWDEPLPPEIKPTKALVDSSHYYVVDLRDASSYAAGHIPNSVNIALRGRLETWVGIMVPWGGNLVLVGDKPDLKEAVHRLHRVGYTAEVLTFDHWKRAGMPVNETPPVSPQALYAQMQSGTAPVIVDVRLPNEWMAQRIGTVLNMPLNQLDRLCRQLDPSEPVVAVCNSAYRSSMAVGILERNGFTTPMSLDGGSEAWINTSLPVFGAATEVQPQPTTLKRHVKLPERIAPADLKRLMMDLPNTFDLVDIRPPEFFADYSLPGSSNVHIADIIANPSYLVGNTPLIIVDRDGSLAMAVGGILCQKTQRPIKVLFGGLEAYWASGTETIIAPPPLTAPAAGALKPPPSAGTPATQTGPPPARVPPRRKSAGC